MIIGKNDIKEYFKKINKKYFAIYYRGKIETGSPIIKTENEETDVEKTYNDFEDALSLLRAGEYSLVSNNTFKVSERGGNRIDFRITLEESMGSGIKETTVPTAVNGIGGSYSMDDVINKAKVLAGEEFEKLMAKHDVERLKTEHAAMLKRAEEAEKKLEDPINRFIGALAPHSDKFVAGIFGTNSLPAAIVPMTILPNQKISGVEHDERVVDNDEATEQTQQIFESFVAALQVARPQDWLAILVKLTTVIQTDPDKFNTALKFI